MTNCHINDPLAAAKAVNTLSAQLMQQNYSLTLGSSVGELFSCRLSTRGSPTTPFFDPEVSGLDAARFFWLKLTTPEGAVVALQAFRFDQVHTSLLDWAPAYHIGLYMRRRELCVPTFAAPPSSSKTQDIKGKLVYHGELWIEPHIRNRKVLNTFTRLGMILSYLKWNADAIWALASEQMATHGHAHRMGYSHVESGFLKWDWAPEGNPLAEYLLLSERKGIEHVIIETNLGLTDEVEPRPIRRQELGQVVPFRLSEYLQEQSR